MDDRDLARELDTHLYDHQERVEDCKVCQQVMKHLSTWYSGMEMGRSAP